MQRITEVERLRQQSVFENIRRDTNRKGREAERKQ